MPSGATLNVVVTQGPPGQPPVPLPPPGTPSPLPPVRYGPPGPPGPPTPGGPPGPGGNPFGPPLPPVPPPASQAGYILPLTVAVSGAVMAFDALVSTLHALDDQTQELVRRGAEWSGPVALAAGMAEFKVTMAEMRRAFILQGPLVEYAGARADLSVAIKDLVTNISRDVIPALTELVKLGTSSVNELNSLREGMIASLAEQLLVLRNMLNNFGMVTPELWRELEELRKVLDQRNQPPQGLDEYKREIMNFFDPALTTLEFQRRAAVPPPRVF